MVISLSNYPYLRRANHLEITIGYYNVIPSGIGKCYLSEPGFGGIIGILGIGIVGLLCWEAEHLAIGGGIFSGIELFVNLSFLPKMT